MSANDHTSAHEEAHTGPIKTPKQLLAAVFFSFVIPIFGIIGLVYYVASANKLAPGAVDTEQAVAQRIQKVGSVEIRDENHIINLISTLPANRTVKLELWRNRQAKSVEAIVAEWKSK